MMFTVGDDRRNPLGPVRKAEVHGPRDAVPSAGFDWREFPRVVGRSSVNWTELPTGPDARKGRRR
jgi:hypothetical protein